MTKRKIIWLAIIFVVYEVLVWGFSLLALSDSTSILIGSVLTICGLTLLGVYVLVARLSARANPPAGAPAAGAPPAAAPPPAAAAASRGEADAVAALIAEANGRLAQSPQLARERARSTIADFPIYVVLGPEASGKTSLFLASGLDLELLAGQVHRESAIVPTRLANIWFGANSVVVEAAGQFFSGDTGRWGHFLEMFQPARGGSSLSKVFASGRRGNIRAIVYCCDVSAFLGIPDTARQSAMAQRAQQQLRKAAEVLGADLPVYVVFTKADNITYFGDYFNRLRETEDQQILGCTMPHVSRSPAASAEAYASVETARLTGALNNLYTSLADKRLVFLERENDRARKPAVYEFPRELRRVRSALVQFLVDVFRPNPLQPNPSLRGFYFTGTRNVPVTGFAAEQSMQRTGLHKVGEVTRIFRPEEFRAEQEAPEIAGSGREQLVTRWSFAGDLWRSILRAGQAAMAPVAVNRRQENLQKLVFAAIAGVSVLVLLLFLTSWVRNRSMLGEVQAAAAACEPLAPHTPPTLRHLQEIDGLRGQLATLVDYDETHPPFSMRFGLYSGGRVIDAARHIYFTRFREYFLNDIVRRLEAGLSTLPAEQTGAHPYQAVYTDLKTYRTIAHSPAEASCAPDGAFSTGLMAMWRADRGVDAESEKLARANFDFYVDALKRKRIPEELMVASKDAPVVKHSRDYLNGFKGIEPQYHRIIEQVNQESPATARLSDLTHNTKYRSVLRVADQVDAAFTRAGWDRVQQLIETAAEGRTSDSCVLGSSLGSRIAGMLPGGSDVKRQLRDMYIRDYIQRWSDFLGKASALPYTNCGDASEKLDLLKDNYSPILAVVLLAAENTTFPQSSTSAAQEIGKAAVESGKQGLLSRLPFGRANQAVKDRVEKALPDNAPGPTQDNITQTFQPARAVFEKPNREHWVDKRNEAYLNALAEMQRAIQALNRGGKCDDADQNANNQANAQMLKGLDAVNGLSRNFDNSGGGIYESVKAFLESPFRGVRPLIMTDPAEVTKRKLNGGQAALCSKLNALSRKYPFNRNVDDDVGLDQMSEVFAPQTGLLGNVRQLLGDNVIKTGSTWTQKPDAPLKLSRSFLAFFNQASAISDALFPPQGPKPAMHYKLLVRPNPGVKEVKGTLDGEAFSMTEKQYTWPAASPRIDLRLVQSGGGDNPLRGYPGYWGIFKMLSGADKRVGPNQFGLVYLQGGKGSLQQSILPDGSPIVVEVIEFPNGVQRAFDPDFFRVGCPAKATED